MITQILAFLYYKTPKLAFLEIIPFGSLRLIASIQNILISLLFFLMWCTLVLYIEHVALCINECSDERVTKPIYKILVDGYIVHTQLCELESTTRTPVYDFIIFCECFSNLAINIHNNLTHIHWIVFIVVLYCFVNYYIYKSFMLSCISRE